MAKAIIAFFSGLTGNEYLLAAILAVIPVTEIKGSILFSAASGGNLLLCSLSAYAASVILCGALSVVTPKTLARVGRSPRLRKISSAITARLFRQAEKITERSQRSGRSEVRNRLLFGVYAFVAIPLPFTGIWAGACLAGILGMDRKDAFFALAAGNFTAGGIVMTVAFLAGEEAERVFNVFLCVALVLFGSALLKAVWKKKRQKAAKK